MSKINSRAKGHAFERQIINLLKELGWTQACSSRSESKRTDDAGIDICFSYPLQIQCKAVEALGSAHATLDRMPKVDGVYNVVFHKKNRQGTTVSMSQNDFFTILKLLLDNQLIKTTAN